MPQEWTTIFMQINKSLFRYFKTFYIDLVFFNMKGGSESENLWIQSF